MRRGEVEERSKTEANDVSSDCQESRELLTRFEARSLQATIASLSLLLHTPDEHSPCIARRVPPCSPGPTPTWEAATVLAEVRSSSHMDNSSASHSNNLKALVKLLYSSNIPDIQLGGYSLKQLASLNSLHNSSNMALSSNLSLQASNNLNRLASSSSNSLHRSMYSRRDFSSHSRRGSSNLSLRSQCAHKQLA